MAQYLPNLNLAYLSVDDLIDLLNFLRPLSQQFDVDGMGAPFTAPIGGRTDLNDETQIGEVVSSIGDWAGRQAGRVVKRLGLALPTTADELDYRASILMAEAIRGGDWEKSAELFFSMQAEEKEFRARGAGA